MNNHKKILLVGIALAFLAGLASSAQDKNVVYNEASAFPLYGNVWRRPRPATSVFLWNSKAW